MTSIAYETVIVDLCIKCSLAELISNETQLTFLWAEKSLAIAPLLNEKEVTELLENATPKTHSLFSRVSIDFNGGVEIEIETLQYIFAI